MEQTHSSASLKSHLRLLPHCCSDGAEYFAKGLIQWVTEGVDADRINTANALDLNQVAPDAGHHRPDMEEGQDGEVNAPDESHGNAKDCRQQAVKPVFCHSERGEACLPDSIKAVGPFRFGNHIFKVNLDHIVVEMLGVPVDQVDLLGVDIMELLLVQFIGHDLVVGLVDVALLPDGRSVAVITPGKSPSGKMGSVAKQSREPSGGLPAGGRASEQASLGSALLRGRKGSPGKRRAPGMRVGVGMRGVAWREAGVGWVRKQVPTARRSDYGQHKKTTLDCPESGGRKRGVQSSALVSSSSGPATLARVGERTR